MISQWADAGWVDCRAENMKKWISRAQQICEQLKQVPVDDTSSRHHHGHEHWNAEAILEPGKLAAWIFIHEDKGKREKR